MHLQSSFGINYQYTNRTAYFSVCLPLFKNFFIFLLFFTFLYTSFLPLFYGQPFVFVDTSAFYAFVLNLILSIFSGFYLKNFFKIAVLKGSFQFQFFALFNDSMSFNHDILLFLVFT